MKSLTVKQLEAALRRNHAERHDINDRITAINNKKGLPGARGLYEGRYFKFNNGTNQEDRWFVYCYCHKVIFHDRAVCEAFECDLLGEWTFHPQKETGLWLFQTEISENEYDRASLNFIAAAMQIRSLKERSLTL